MSTVRIQVRRGTAAEWTSVNPTLAAGEMGVETDTRKLKIGTGNTAWTSLSYIASDSPAITEIAQDAIDQALSMGSGLAKSYNDGTNTISITVDTNVIATNSYVDNAVGGLQNTVTSDYVLLADVGNAGGPAKLDVDGNLLVPKSSIILEGATADAFETTLRVTDPTADRTITFPDATTTVVGTDTAQTLSNKTLTTPTINGGEITATGGTPRIHGIYLPDAHFITFEGTTNNEFETVLEAGDPTADRTVTLPNASGTLALTSYVDNAVSGLVDSAPATLNTLNELAEALGDNPNYATTITTILGTMSQAGSDHAAASTSVHGIANTADLMLKSGSTMTGRLTLSSGPENNLHAATKKYVDDNDSLHAGLNLNVHGISNTQDLVYKSGSTMTGPLVLSGNPVSNLESATKQYVDAQIDNTEIYADDSADAAVLAHTAIVQNVHGIADTSLLATKSYADTAEADAITAAGTAADTKIANAVAALTKSSVGLANVDNTSDANKPVSSATQTALELKLASATAASTYAPIASPTFTGTVSGITKSMVGLGNVDNTTDANKPISTATQTELDLKLASATASSTYAPLANPTFTGTVSGVTKSHVGLGNVDNTADASKPVSTAQATAIATAKSEAIADATSQVTAVINGAPAAFDTLKEIADYIATDQTAASAVTSSLALKAPLASPTFTGTVSGITKSMVGLGSVDNTADSAKPVSTATQTALDLKLASATAATTYAPLASPTFTGTVSGVTKSHVGLGNVDNTSDANKPVSTAAQTALDLKLASATAATTYAPLASPTFTGTVTVAASGVAFTDGTQTKAGVPSITNIPTAIEAGAITLASGQADQFIPLTGAVVITLPSSGYSTGQSIDFYQESSTGARFESTNGVVGTPGLKFRSTNSVVTAMKTPSGWLVFGDLLA